MKLYKEKRHIKRDDGSIYMTRWYLIKNRFFGINLHKIIASDHNCCHDHPWDFISLILKGGYIEHVEKVVKGARWSADDADEDTITNFSKIIHPFSLLFRKAEHRHRLEIHQPCWSLVLTLKVRRRWGFWTKKGWMHWKIFTEKDGGCQ